MRTCRSGILLSFTVLIVASLAPPAFVQPDEGKALEGRIVKLMAAGKWAEAIPLAERLTELARVQKGEYHLDTAKSLVTLASLYNVQRRLTEAEALLKRALAIREQALGATHADTMSILGLLGPIYRAQGRVAEAEVLEQRGRESVIQRYSSDDPVSLGNQAGFREAQGEHAEAEQLYQRALSAAEEKHGLEHPRIVINLNALAQFYRRQARFAEAEALLKRGLAIREKTNELAELQLQTARAYETSAKLSRQEGRHAEADSLNKKAQENRAKALDTENSYTAQSLEDLAAVYVAQGRHGEAEPLHERALAIRVKESGSESENTAASVEKLAARYRSQRRFAEAESLYQRALAIREKLFEKDTIASLGSLGDLALIYEELGRYHEAEQLMQRSHAVWLSVHGPEAPLTAASHVRLSAFYLRAQKWSDAYQASKRATAITIQQMRREGEIARQPRGSGEPIGIDAVRRTILLAHVGVAARLAEQARDQTGLLAESYVTAQWGLQSSAAAALAQMAARFGKGEDELARLVRERQDLVARYRAIEESRVLAVAAPEIQRVTAAKAEEAKEVVAIDERIEAIDVLLGRKFPEFGSLANPEPLSITDTQAQLKVDEALYLVQFGDDQGYAWVVTRESAHWQPIVFGARILAEKVQTLRCGLDSSNWTDPSLWPAASPDEKRRKQEQLARRERCKRLTGMIVSDGDPLPFDLAKAHELYAGLLGPFENLLRGKRLLIVASGQLTTLPFEVLVTERPATAIPANPRNYERAAWLTKRHSIAVLPSVASLRALRRFARTSRATSRYAGFGNPLLLGPDGNDDRAAQRQACPTVPLQTVRVAGRLAPDDTARFVRGGLADADKLRRQYPLPETTDELCTVARELGSPESDLYLGAKATEATVMALSASGTLARYQIIHFATHGLLARETEHVAQSVAEPALLLTPPDVATEADDGLLTASEVAKLQLDADWIVLSACNTAGGSDKGDAEALSGLARAFFYAGARALLVSHWYVDSDAAVKLTTRAFAALKADPSIGRAEAMRLAVLALMADQSRPAAWTPAAHPAVWAPFVVVGEGAARR